MLFRFKYLSLKEGIQHWKLVSFDSMFQMVYSSAIHMWILESVNIKTVYRTLEIIWWTPSFYRLGHWGTGQGEVNLPRVTQHFSGRMRGDPWIQSYCTSSLVFLTVGRADQAVWVARAVAMGRLWIADMLGKVCVGLPAEPFLVWNPVALLRPVVPQTVASPFLSFIAVGPGDSAHFNNINN